MSVDGLMDYVASNATLLVPLLEAEGKSPSPVARRQSPDPPTGRADGLSRVADPETCRLLGPFALVVQAIMGGLVLGSLAIKRAREKPRRKWKVWISDVAKQVVGQMVLHAMNVLVASAIAAHKGDNPCAGYAVNIVVDTTFGVGVLYGCLKLSTSLLHHFDPTYRTGFYGEPFSFGMWARQCGVYVLAVIAMKLVVVVVFWLFPGMFTIANWSLAWLDSDEAQLLIVMLVLPTCMNMFQFLLLDTILRFKSPDAASEADSSERRYFLENDDDDESFSDDEERAIGGRRHRHESDDSDAKVSARPIDDGKLSSGVKSHVTVASSNSTAGDSSLGGAGSTAVAVVVDGFSYPPTASSSVNLSTAPGLRSRANSSSSSAAPSRVASPLATRVTPAPAPIATPAETADTSAFSLGAEEEDVDDADWGFEEERAEEVTSEKLHGPASAVTPPVAQWA